MTHKYVYVMPNHVTAVLDLVETLTTGPSEGIALLVAAAASIDRTYDDDHTLEKFSETLKSTALSMKETGNQTQ